MWPIVTDKAWSVCVLITIMSCAKTYEPTEMRFEAGLRVGGPTEPCVRVYGPDVPEKGAILGISRPTVKYSGYSA